MEIIPVIDLLNGEAVAAIRGERSVYRPVKSDIVDTSVPLDVARALLGVTGCRTMYVADLDAIQGRAWHMDVLRELFSLPVEFIVDAGVSGPDEVLALTELGSGRAILGTETLPSLSMLDEMAGAAGRDRVLPSLDVRNGTVLTAAPELQGLHPLDGLARLVDMGLDTFILLTLDVVGTGGGPDWPLLEAAVRKFPAIDILAGGGIASPDDLRRGAALGLTGGLTATALHRGWITAADVKAAREELA
ncbi:MAG: HisA/HisF-related TIM barrel protein [Pseudodesulfovibrio sp.]|jgi:phosphoribosylformimino-5-aminoimidazole carboxamide ribotide isomerase|uniref:HisA/HisF-related TIM barrel protein n=1 Tax=Pseudodesulfovibrio sp. TaxID=2035812 RepID=UPI003D0F30D7